MHEPQAMRAAAGLPPSDEEENHEGRDPVSLSRAAAMGTIDTRTGRAVDVEGVYLSHSSPFEVMRKAAHSVGPRGTRKQAPDGLDTMRAAAMGAAGIIEYGKSSHRRDELRLSRATEADNQALQSKLAEAFQKLQAEKKVPPEARHAIRQTVADLIHSARLAFDGNPPDSAAPAIEIHARKQFEELARKLKIGADLDIDRAVAEVFGALGLGDTPDDSEAVSATGMISPTGLAAA